MSQTISKTAKTRTTRFKLQSLLLTALLLLANDLHAVEPSFTYLPDLPNGHGGFERTFVSALSANGEVAVGESGFGGNPVRPFRWTKETGTVALWDYGAATGISADGTVVVGYGLGPGTSAVRWTASGVERLEHWGVHPSSYPSGVSADGTTVVGMSYDQAVVWTADGSVMALGLGDFSNVVAASSDGSIVAGDDRSDDNATEAFRWTATEGVVPLGHLPGDTNPTHYFVADMTPDGRVIVGFRAGEPTRGYRWTLDGGMVELDFLPTEISDDGRMMIGHVGLNEPVIWTESGGVAELKPFLTSLGLDLAGWGLGGVTALSGDGTTIAGRIIPPGSATYGSWIATIPEPSTWALGGSALAVAMLSGFLRRRRRSHLRSGRILMHPGRKVVRGAWRGAQTGGGGIFECSTFSKT
jgi:uncharacterized membrane protein